MVRAEDRKPRARYDVEERKPCAGGWEPPSMWKKEEAGQGTLGGRGTTRQWGLKNARFISLKQKEKNCSAGRFAEVEG